LPISSGVRKREMAETRLSVITGFLSTARSAQGRGCPRNRAHSRFLSTPCQWRARRRRLSQLALATKTLAAAWLMRRKASIGEVTYIACRDSRPGAYQCFSSCALAARSNRRTP
jgi:hypothetical protein